MSLYKRGSRYWTAFAVEGTTFRKPTGTTKLNDAKRRERELIEEASRGHLTAKARGPKRLFAAIDAYIERKRIRWSGRTLELAGERFSIIKAHFGDVPLSAITSARIADFQHVRKDAGKANRTVNMEVGFLSRVLKLAGQWRALEEHVELLPEHQHIIGRALTAAERTRLFEAAASNPEWEHVYCAAVIAATTSMRRVEVTNLKRRDVDLFNKTVMLQRSKTEAGRRIIPLNDSALKALTRMFQRADALGHDSPDHYLWFKCQWNRFDPTQPLKKWDTAWRALRTQAKLPGLRFHDLRHTFITELAEKGVSDAVLKSLVGHVTQRMLEHYSHVRMIAKRAAVDGLEQDWKREAEELKSTGDAETVQ